MIIRWSYILLRILILASKLILNVLPHSLVLCIQIEVVYHIIVLYLISFILTQMLSIVFKDVIGAHRKLSWGGSSSLLLYELLLL